MTKRSFALIKPIFYFPNKVEGFQSIAMDHGPFIIHSSPRIQEALGDQFTF